MSTRERPMPPEEAGWYCVNLRTCAESREPGELICKPEIVYYDPANFPDDVSLDPLSPCLGGIQGVEEVEIWGERVLGLGQKRLDEIRPGSRGTPLGEVL